MTDQTTPTPALPTWLISLIHTVDFYDTLTVQAATEAEAIELAKGLFEEKPDLSDLVEVEVVDVERFANTTEACDRR